MNQCFLTIFNVLTPSQHFILLHVWGLGIEGGGHDEELRVWHNARCSNLFFHRVNVLPALDRASGYALHLP